MNVAVKTPHSLPSKFMDIAGSTESWNDVGPEEQGDEDDLVEGATEEKIKWVHFPRVLHALLLHDIH